MTAYETVTIATDGPVATLTLNRPDVLNAFNGALCRDLIAAVAEIDADPAVKAVVLTGAGRAFSAGADLRESRLGEDVTEGLMTLYKPSLDGIARSDKPWIAAINGPAAGIGAAYALTCDLSVMDAEAYVYQAFTNIGLIPDGANHWLMLKALGRRRAYEAIVEGTRIGAEECRAAGLANRVVEPGTALAEAQAWAASLALRAPRTLRHAKRVLREAETSTREDSFALEAELQRDCTTSKDAHNAVAAFLKKEKPVFTGE